MCEQAGREGRRDQSVQEGPVAPWVLALPLAPSGRGDLEGPAGPGYLEVPQGQSGPAALWGQSLPAVQ